MDFAFTPEQQELKNSAAAFLRENSSSESVRKAMESELGYDPALWRRIGAELGWPSVTIPEAYGGSGLGSVELVALLEEMGAALLCSPFFASVCLAANALLVGGSTEQKQQWLPGIASGETTATLAWLEPGGGWDAAGIRTVARRSGGDFVLEGRKSFVVDGHAAALLIVAARREGSQADDGVELFAIPGNAAGLGRERLPTMDQTRKQAVLRLDGVKVPAAARLGEEGEGGRILADTLDRAAVALAAEQVGGAQRCLDQSVAHAKERVQFGRPIGAFQAIKHKCADMMLRVESARSASYSAGWAAAAGDSELPLLASLAAAYCAEAFFFCAAQSLQIHGGIGFTWEHDAHLYFKRARSSRSLLGDPAFHRERVARRIGL